MEKQPLISYIVPMYNAERYVEGCVKSLFAQTYKNIEYIFVDDCSEDSTVESLRKILDKHPREGNIRVLELDENVGSAVARAKGIAVSNGAYIMFCDVDDYVEPDMAENLVNVAIVQDCDIVVSSYFVNSATDETVVKIADGNGIDINDVPINTLYFALWNKLFRAELLKSDSLNNVIKINCWDDLCLVARVYALAKKVVRVSTPYYHYRHSAENATLTQQRHEVRLEDHLACAEYVVKWFESNGYSERYATFLKFLKFTSKIKMLRGKKIDVRRWKRTFPEANCGIMGYKHVGVAYRFCFLAVSVLPSWLSQAIANVAVKFRS